MNCLPAPSTLCLSSFGFALGNAESQSMEVVNRVRVDYEKKLSDLLGELRKLEVAKMEHAKMLKSQAQYEKQCRDLQRDLTEMKKMKVYSVYGALTTFLGVITISVCFGYNINIVMAQF